MIKFTLISHFIRKNHVVYHIVKYLTRAAVWSFYRNVHIRGLENLPKSGPLIICGNHSNAFLDALILGCHIPRKIKSLPRGTIFFTSGPVLRWLFREVGMIPIFRAMEGTENLHRNEETFKVCFDVIKKGGAISVFPEGICIPERRIKAMKKGAARIIFGAEELNNFSLDTKIIFVGLNYEKAWRFKTDLFLNYSRVHGIQEFIGIYKENKVKGINELTKFLKPNLTNQVVHIAEPGYNDFVEQVEILYSDQLSEEYKLSKRNLEHKFMVSREIARGINYHFEENTENIRVVQQETDAYFKQLSSLDMDDKILSNIPGNFSVLWKIMATVIGFPLHVYGLINNYIPAKIAKTAADKLVKKVDFYSSVTVLVGLCSFLFFYPLMTFLFWGWSNSMVLTVIYASTLYLSGNYSAYYIEELKELRATVSHILFKRNDPSKFDQLLETRHGIVNNLVRLKERYRSRNTK
ncbi:1-acyl-sn-glycerol-3-phosphate acyltransferase [Flavobacteriales bacterium AH-315-E23]|nr:1-acyl-sn-glycerol-3-phosphate acyltransferase [Flavobacteriales bacterium AH-315-E23]